MSLELPPHNKTRKKRTNIKDLNNVWKMFDSENKTKKKNTIKCIYNIDSATNDFCDQCSSILYINEENFMSCSNRKCGKLFKNILNNSAEWRYYNSNDSSGSDPSRCGMPINPLLKESSYGCSVTNPYGSTYEMKKIRRYTEWQSMPYKEKSKYDEFEKIKTLAGFAGVPKIIIDSALRTHDQLSGEKTFRGLNRDGVIAASIYISCRMNNYPRTAKELSVMFNLDTTSATKGCKNAMFILNKLEKDMKNNEKSKFKKTEPIDFIERYCSKLNMNNELIKFAKFICYKIDKNNYLLDNAPHSVAAGIIYFIAELCNINITKQDINKASNISEVTINKCYKRICEFKQNIVPPSLIDKYKY
jgi:transcription initiation factor TFIIB